MLRPGQIARSQRFFCRDMKSGHDVTNDPSYFKVDHVKFLWALGLQVGVRRNIWLQLQTIECVVKANHVDGCLIEIPLFCKRGRTLEVSEELGITQSVISRLWQRFQDDGNVSRWMLLHRLPPSYNADRGPVFGSYFQKKQTEHSIRRVSSALFSYRHDSFKADRVHTLRAHWFICS
ncbi:uncharacterized protein TNCV_1844721 [Trichonephila clavipes]|nr:uncharacterized protein TNCV_1844721 [Trichonephila clavipes]